MVLNPEHESVVKAAVSIRVAVVRVSFFLLVPDGALDEPVSCVLHVHHLEVLCVPNHHAHLKDLLGFGAHVPLLVSLHRAGHNVDPHLDYALVPLAGLVVQLAMFNGFDFHGIPICAEIPVLKVNQSFSDEIIAEQRVVVPQLDLQNGTAGELRLKFYPLVDVWVRLVVLIVFPVIELIIT
jgi:hypothetical protein